MTTVLEQRYMWPQSTDSNNNYKVHHIGLMRNKFVDAWKVNKLHSINNNNNGLWYIFVNKNLQLNTQ